MAWLVLYVASKLDLAFILLDVLYCKTSQTFACILLSNMPQTTSTAYGHISVTIHGMIYRSISLIK